MQTTKYTLYCKFVLMFVMFSASFSAHAKDDKNENNNNKGTGGAVSSPTKVIWRDPGDVASLNLFYGAGGKERAPNPQGKFKFVKEDRQGTNPKFEVTDDQGVTWKVKLGPEAQSETAATRLLWAAGYFVDTDYYLADIKVTGLPRLRRGANFVSKDGTVHGARLERKYRDEENVGTWDWFAHPPEGKRELNGLRVMMSLVNNWDLATKNNAIYEVADERRYLVSDLGASLGVTGNVFARSKSSPKDYAKSKFIKQSNPEFVDFVMHSRPFFLAVFNFPKYRDRARMEKITRHIPRDDAKWLASRLSQLSEQQVGDCFRAAGYAPDEVSIYTKAVRKRIAELSSL